MKTKNSLENRCLDMVSKMIEYKVRKENRQWPPVCLGLIYQPKRPMKMRKEVKDECIRNKGNY